MANTKITELTAVTALAGTDVFPVVDVSASTTNKVSVSDLLRNAPDGTADAPSIANAGDQDTGIFFPAANSVAVSTAGTQKLVIDSSGDATLSGDLTISAPEGTSAALLLQADQGDDNGDTWRIISNQDDNDLTFSNNVSGSFVNKVTFLKDGKVGIGALSPKRQLHINGGNESVKIQLTNQTTGSSTDGDGFQIAIATNGDAYLEQRENSPLIFTTNNNERMRIDSSGRLLVGTTSARGVGHGTAGAFEIEATSGTVFASVVKNSADAFGGSIALGKSRGTSVGANTAVQSGDELGSIRFAGADGTDVQTRAAQITAAVDGTPGSNDMPGRLVFSTTADAASSPTERMRIDSSGRVLIGTTSAANATTFLQVENSAGDAQFTINSGTSSESVINMGDTDDFNIGAIRYNQSDNAFRFFTNNTERMRIDSSGRLCLGTTTSSVLSTFALSSTNAYSATGDINTSNVGLRLYNSNGSDGTGVNNYTGIQLNVGSGATSSGSLAYVRTADNKGAFVFNQRTGASSYAEAMRIDSSGNVGISRSIPDNQLSIGSTASFHTDSNSFYLGSNFTSTGSNFIGTSKYAQRLFFNNASGNGYLSYSNTSSTGTAGASIAWQERLRLTNDGKLGVGTSTPITTLDVRGGITVQSGQAIGSTSSGGTLQIQGGASLPGGSILLGGGTGNNNIKFLTSGTTERMRIDSSGKVGIGTTSPVTLLQVGGYSGDNAIQIGAGTSSTSALYFSDSGSGADVYRGYVQYRHSTDALQFGTASTERMQIDSSGNALFGTTTNGTTAKGIVLRATGELLNSRSGGPPLLVNRLTNDGTLVDFRAQNNSEGSISVSGTTVSYNGGHLSRWSQLAGGAERTEILRGSVLSNLDEMCEWGEEDNEQLNRMKVSDVEGDVNVSGVFQDWDDDDDTYTNDFYCAMTGDFVIRIAQGTTVARGDLLMSAGDGTAKPQDDDIVRSKTIAKVTSTTVSTTYADGSYCVPCVLMAC